jgi:rRNA maturation RNase YbeY
LYCDSKKTHEINREYREKDYPADIITFAIFADTAVDERFVFDGEINLGEIIIALIKLLRKLKRKAKQKNKNWLF